MVFEYRKASSADGKGRTLVLGTGKRGFYSFKAELYSGAKVEAWGIGRYPDYLPRDDRQVRTALDAFSDGRLQLPSSAKKRGR